jgi:hypothetical protein
VFCLIRLGLEPTIYYTLIDPTLGEHVYHYTTNAVTSHMKLMDYMNNSLYQFRIFLSDAEPTSVGIQISKKKNFKALVYIEYLFNFLTEKVLKYYNNV